MMDRLILRSRLSQFGTWLDEFFRCMSSVVQVHKEANSTSSIMRYALLSVRRVRVRLNSSHEIQTPNTLCEKSAHQLGTDV